MIIFNVSALIYFISPVMTVFCLHQESVMMFSLSFNRKKKTWLLFFFLIIFFLFKLVVFIELNVFIFFLYIYKKTKWLFVRTISFQFFIFWRGVFWVIHIQYLARERRCLFSLLILLYLFLIFNFFFARSNELSGSYQNQEFPGFDSLIFLKSTE